MPIGAQINGRLYAIDSDHLNTPRRRTNAQGQVAWQWLITGYGEVAPPTGATGYAFEAPQLGGSSNTSGNVYSEEVNFKLRYPGQVWDEETGLSYNLNRYYDAQAGRYVQSDPIGLDGGWNRFGYVGGNPLSNIDPKGQDIVLPGPVPLPVTPVFIPGTPENTSFTQSTIQAISNGVSMCQASLENAWSQLDKLISKQNQSGPDAIQYALLATRNALYPTVRGDLVFLNRGDVWKYGTTIDPAGRYSSSALSGMNLVMQPQSTGSVSQVLVQENIQLINHFFQNGELPPGNRIFK